jgi:hypothetical protein
VPVSDRRMPPGFPGHCADQVVDRSNHIRLKRAQNVAVIEVAVDGDAGDKKFGFSIVEPSNRILLPECQNVESTRR